ncbi:DoxX family protein [Pajaroellobacter abortibovis]|uniref:DoxX family protein n=2 Tax=Pajaroellobacter abortibovis TaxID=1882918 RepID=A0A1L6MXP1_9BACT|nr:DoxX family protein [Pajaroellobacter abortibovis]
MWHVLFPRIDTTRGDIPILLLRTVAGAAFLIHGWKKIQDPVGWIGPGSSIPGVLQALAALSEFGGGGAWILGLLTPLVSAGILSTMSVALWMHISVWGDPFVGSPSSYELPLLYAIIAILLLRMGPGRFSIDAILSRQLTPKKEDEQLV